MSDLAITIAVTAAHVGRLNDLAQLKTGRDWVRVDSGVSPPSYTTVEGYRIDRRGNVSAARRAAAYLIVVLETVGCDLTFAERAVVNRVLLAMPRLWVHGSMKDVVARAEREVLEVTAM